MFKSLENIGCGGCKRLKYHVNTFSTPIQFPSQFSIFPPYPPPQKKKQKNKKTNKNKKTETAPLIRCTWWLTVLTFESVSLSLSQDNILKGDHCRGRIQKIQKGVARTVLPAI